MNRQSRAFHTGNRGEVADFGGALFGIAGQFGTGEMLELAFTGGLAASADGGGGFDLVIGSNFSGDL